MPVDFTTAMVGSNGQAMATESKQDTGNTSLAAIDTKLTSQATAAKQDTAQTSLTAIVSSVASIDGGTPAALGQTTMSASMPVALASDQSNLPVTAKTTTTGGSKNKKVISAASTNATSVKASAGQVYGWHFSNSSASKRYLKLYNKASAPTVGTDVPVMTIEIQTTTAANCEWTNGIDEFATGIALAITGGVADNDTTAIAANDVILNLLYK
jgi:hypothetical protein